MRLLYCELGTLFVASSKQASISVKIIIISSMLMEQKFSSILKESD